MTDQNLDHSPVAKAGLLQRLLRRGAVRPLIILAARVFGAVLGLVLSLMMARVMGAHEMGRALTAMSLAMILPILASGSCEIGASRFITQALFRHETARAAGFIGMNWQVAAICIPLVIAIGLTGIMLTMPAGHDRLALGIAIVSGALMGLLRIGSAHAMGFSRVIVATLPGTFLRPLMLVLFLGLYVLVSATPPTAPVVLACFFLSAVVNLGLQQALLAPEYRRLADAGRDMSESRSWISYGLQMGATMLFIEYSKEITVLFSSLSLQPTDIARLSVALSFVGFARFAVIAVNQSITPDLSRSIAANDNGRLLDIVDRSSLMKITAALAGLVLFTLFGRQLLGLYDDEFAKAWWLLPVLMVDPLCLAVLGPSSNVLSLTGQQRVLMLVALVMVPVLAGLVFLGGKLAGLPGAATGATIGWVSFYGILSWLVWRERGVNLTLPGTLARRFAR
ncbi:hypothetical protein GL279_13905 [Paracoccus limosus]|uniref:Polysaccharide biosynthesis protein C-terminal domain-containing protein n=1 Tax=Paracoccus limosus TaxID=913252 RepID=A0A844H4A9_9RHOB|nr:hypothetical protein [Paracoccus limosus]MTH35696.1 hypothetical protein [Paracoccus limosus]